MTKRADVTAATEADVVVKKSLAAKLAQLEDKFLKEADISSLLHPCQYSIKVQGNAMPSQSWQCVDCTPTEQRVGAGASTENSADTKHATSGLSQKENTSDIDSTDGPEGLASNSEHGDNTGEYCRA